MNKKILELLNSSEEYININSNLSLKSALEALEMSKMINSKPEITRSFIRLAHVLSEKGEILNSLSYAYKAIKILKYESYMVENVEVYTVLGIIYLRAGELDKALENFTKAMTLSNDFGDTKYKPILLSGIGTVLNFKHSYEDSLDYFRQAIYTAKAVHDIYTELKSLNNLACSLNSLQRVKEAETYINECISLCKRVGNIDILISALDELGTIYQNKGNAKKAVKIWEEVLAIESKRGQFVHSIGPCINLAHYYTSIKEWDKAHEYLGKAFNTAEKSNSPIDYIEIYKLKSSIYEKKGDFEEALKNYKKYFELEKQVRTQESVRKLKQKELEAVTETMDRILLLSKLGREITGSLDLKTILGTIYSNINSVIDFSMLGIGMVDNNSNDISFDMFLEEGLMVPPFVIKKDNKNSIAAWCVRNKKKVVISDIEKEYSKYIKSITKINSIGEKKKDELTKSVIYSPLLVQNELIGVMTIQSYNVNSFSDQDIESFDLLTLYISIALNNAKQLEMIQSQNKALSILATSDSLTGLKNRRAFFDSVDKCWSWSVRTKVYLSIILMDLDFFKDINDNFGHPAGDYCLIEVSKILKSVIKRDNDIVSRVGGEEFCIFLGDADTEGALYIAENIRVLIEEKVFEFEGNILPVTASFGVRTISPSIEKSKTIDDVIAEADKALYIAKDEGRNCVRKFK